ncbi:MAG: hypothetical protein ABH840_01780 [Nanoarchaeota archaeon]
MVKGKSLIQVLRDTNRKIGVLDRELSKLDDLEKEICRLDDLKREAGKLEEIKEVIEGLKRTENDSKRKGFYEGKYAPSYRYVERIEEDDIVATKEFKPGMRYSCPDCGSEVPVLRYYHQEYDSPEGDTWVTKALAICCDKIYEIKKFVDN